MTRPIITFVSQIGDRVINSLTDALGNIASQVASLGSKYQMSYGQLASDANDTIVVPTWYYEGQHSISIASGTYDIDLTLLADIYGFTLANGKIYKIIINNNDVSGGSGLIVKPSPSNGWTGPWDGSTSGQNRVAPGGKFLLEDPYLGMTVNSGSRMLRIQNDAASPSGAASFNLHLVGS